LIVDHAGREVKTVKAVSVKVASVKPASPVATAHALPARAERRFGVVVATQIVYALPARRGALNEK
jgi:hypothetical protein